MVYNLTLMALSEFLSPLYDHFETQLHMVQLLNWPLSSYGGRDQTGTRFALKSYGSNGEADPEEDAIESWFGWKSTEHDKKRTCSN